MAPPSAQPYPPRPSPSPSPVCIVSLTTGILGVLGSFACVVFGLPLGVVAVATGIIGLVQVRDQQGEGRALAIAGVGFGGLAIVLPIVLFLLAFRGGLY